MNKLTYNEYIFLTESYYILSKTTTPSLRGKYKKLVKALDKLWEEQNSN